MRRRAERHALESVTDPCPWCGDASRYRCQMCHGDGVVRLAGNAVRWLYGWRHRLGLL